MSPSQLDYICKNVISKSNDIHRFWGIRTSTHLYGGHDWTWGWHRSHMTHRWMGHMCLRLGEDRAKGGTAGQLAGSFLEVAGPRWPQGGHLYSLNCWWAEMLQGCPGSVDTRPENPQQFPRWEWGKGGSQVQVSRKRSFVLRGRQEGRTTFNLAPWVPHSPHAIQRVLSSAPLLSAVVEKPVGSAPTSTVWIDKNLFNFTDKLKTSKSVSWAPNWYLKTTYVKWTRN